MRLKRFFAVVGITAVAVVGALLWLSAPTVPNAERMAGLTGDPDNGATMFRIGGCASCHAAKGAEGEARLTLAGGQRFVTDFGVFVAPNISPGGDGVGGWSLIDFANAMQAGVSPDGAHYYPAFPYTSYNRMSDQDVADLWAYLITLPVVDGAAPAHGVGFPFNIRRSLGLWKRLYLDPDYVGPAPSLDAARGRYLVEGPGHCAECHTPRTAFGGLDLSRWMRGGPNPDGEGKIPGLTRADLSWSTADIAEYLRSGFTPEYDVAGGAMTEVIRNTSQLSDADRQAIAAYIVTLE